MGEKSGVTSPEHVRCSGGKTVCGCKARAQTTRDGTARYGWGKEEAVCEGWDQAVLLATASGGFFLVEEPAQHSFDTMQSIMKQRFIRRIPIPKKKAAQRNSRRVASHSLKRLGERRLGGGERGPFSKRAPSPDIILFNAKFVLPQLVEDGAHGDRHHTGKERDPLFR